MQETDSIQINLNSKFATKYIDNSHSNCRFDLPNIRIPRQHHVHVSVANAIIPYSFYNISSSNNTLHMVVDTTNFYTLHVTPGNYNALQLASYLRQHLTNFNVTYDAITNRFTFTQLTSLTFTIDSGSTILRTLGFNNVSINSTGSVLVSTIGANLQNIQCIHIQSNFLTGNINSSDIFKQNTICTIPVNSPPNSNIVYANDNSFTTNLYSATLNDIEIKIVDQDNQLLDLNGLDWSITLQMDIVDFAN